MVHAESGNVGVVNKLLDSHAFMDAQDMVRIACLPASNVSVATSFTNCVYTSITCMQRGQTALMKSSFRGRLEVVQEMVRRGALIDLKCKV